MLTINVPGAVVILQPPGGAHRLRAAGGALLPSPDVRPSDRRRHGGGARPGGEAAADARWMALQPDRRRDRLQ